MVSLVKKALAKMGLLNFYHLFLAWISSLIYKKPSHKLVVVGVTGTKGKSTVLELINAGLERAGEKTVLASSVRFKVGDESNTNSTGNTMPGRGFLQRLMKQGLDKGCKYALLEVVSEGIIQHRHRFIDFNAAVFVNIHPEHIESHGSFEKYRAAKVKFFEDVEKHNKSKAKFFINQEDENANHFIEAVDKESVVLSKKTNKPLSIPGEFNKENAGLAQAVLRELGISEKIIDGTFRHFEGVEGRMEKIQSDPFKVIVDYAHTPDSLEKVYETLKPKSEKLICILGAAGGGRDKWKRPELGKIADKYCDQIILTDEDPFDEDPNRILEEVEKGISTQDKSHKLIDRYQAISKAISLAQKGDTVIITGKGSEPYIRVAKGKRIPWSDKEVVKEILG